MGDPGCGTFADRADVNDAHLANAALERDVATATDHKVCRIVPKQCIYFIVVHFDADWFGRVSGATVYDQHLMTRLQRQPDLGVQSRQSSDDQLSELALPRSDCLGELPDGSRQVSLRSNAYMGPGAPPGPYHHYTFELYALDIRLDVPQGTPQQAAETRAAIVNAMDGHVLGKAVLVGRFHR